MRWGRYPAESAAWMGCASPRQRSPPQRSLAQRCSSAVLWRSWCCLRIRVLHSGPRLQRTSQRAGQGLASPTPLGSTGAPSILTATSPQADVSQEPAIHRPCTASGRVTRTFPETIQVRSNHVPELHPKHNMPAVHPDSMGDPAFPPPELHLQSCSSHQPSR